MKFFALNFGVAILTFTVGVSTASSWHFLMRYREKSEARMVPKISSASITHGASAVKSRASGAGALNQRLEVFLRTSNTLTSRIFPILMNFQTERE